MTVKSLGIHKDNILGCNYELQLLNSAKELSDKLKDNYSKKGINLESHNPDLNPRWVDKDEEGTVENNSWCLDFPHDLKETHNEIIHRIGTLINYLSKHKLSVQNVDIIVDHARVHKENAEKGVRIMEMTEALEEAKKELEYHNWANTSTYFKIVNALERKN